MHTEHATEEELSALLDGELTAAERTRVEAHLRRCAVCQRELEQLRQTVVWLQALPTPAAPRSFALSPDAGAAGWSTGERLRPVWLQALAGLAAALMVLVFVADALQTGPMALPSATTAARAPLAAPASQARDSVSPAATIAPAAEAAGRPAPAAAPAGPAEEAPSRAAAPPVAARSAGQTANRAAPAAPAAQLDRSEERGANASAPAPSPAAPAAAFQALPPART